MGPEPAAAIAQIQANIRAACARSGRRPEEVTLLAASKTVEPERIRAAYAAGVRAFGENRVQERAAKQAALADLAIEWHLLGPLQSNKAARALELFDVVETVDSLPLAERLNRLAPSLARGPLRVLIEVNVAQEAQKHGVAPDAVAALARAVVALPHLRLEGLMGIPPAAEEPEASRPHFRALAALHREVRSGLPAPPPRWELSMGMSHDYEVAVEEGATLVRVGTAIFGARPPLPHAGD
ncbi:MAG: YggS family pyridoxal phosphate-dependent enzyme [Terriglobales bacterium]